VVAVITQVPVGPHTGWPITYFSEKDPIGILENDWGSNKHDSYDDNGELLGWSVSDPDIEGYDFDLSPWIQSGKLQWINPADPSIILQQELIGCPYINLAGPHKYASIHRGEIRQIGVEEITAAREQLNR
jgi:hypothetical protein